MINDTYRSDICLLYPPHLIAIAALYLVCVLNPSIRAAHQEWSEQKQAQSSSPAIRRSARHSHPSSNVPQKRSLTSENGSSDNLRKSRLPPQDFVGFFANLNVNMRLVASVAQEIVSFYALCDRLKEDFNPSSAQSSSIWTRSSQMPPQSSQGDNGEGASGSDARADVDSNSLVRLLAHMRATREAGPEPEKLSAMQQFPLGFMNRQRM